MRTWAKYFIASIFVFLIFTIIGKMLDNDAMLCISFVCYALAGLVFLVLFGVVFVATLRASIKYHKCKVYSVCNICSRRGIFVEMGTTGKSHKKFIQTSDYNDYRYGDIVTIAEYPTIVKIIMKDKYFLSKGE